jgi:hypothetical protein
LIEIAPNQPLSSSPSTSNTLETPNFLVDNDLLPLPPPVQTEQEIIEDFLLRAQRPNRDLVTTLINVKNRIDISNCTCNCHIAGFGCLHRI